MKRKNDKGITLLALVITIIVLLILAGVTIATLTGDNGILTKAGDAKTSTEIGDEKEKVELSAVGALAKDNGGEIKREYLNDELTSYIGTEGTDYTLSETAPFVVKYLDSGRSYVIDENGNVREQVDVDIPEGLEIGSEVSYKPSGTYEWKSKYCSSPEDTSYEKTLDSNTGKPFNIEKWKVFDINEGTGEITLVPEHSTDDGGDGTIYLKGAQGYNNSVYLLNEACSNLYGDSSKGIKARSINIEDIEGKMTSTKLEEAHGSQYGKQVSSAYSENNSYYPSLYAKEILSVINGNKNSSGLGMSDYTSTIPVEPTADGATNGYLQAQSIQPYQTYWNADNNFMQTAFETAGNGVNYYNLLMPDGGDTYYWVASRCVGTLSSVCDFSVSSVSRGEVRAYFTFNSYDSTNYDCYGLFPVVTLSSELINGNATEGFSVK